MKKAGGQKNILNTIQKGSVRFVVALALFLIPLINLPSSPVLAASEEEQLNQINQQIQQANKKLNETTAQKKTLQGELASFDRQIGDIQGQINTTDNQITKLNSLVTVTENEINVAEVELTKTRSNLAEYLSIIYEEGQVTTLELIASSQNFSDFVNRTEYLESIQGKIKDMADAVIAEKQRLEAAKKSLETQKTEAETLRSQQASQRSDLANQRSGRNQLLVLTKGNEAEYQALLAKLKKEQDALEAVIWSRNNGNVVSLGHVNAGDIIGYIGNTGYSTGCHLHFEIRNSGQQHVNPANYINNGFFIHPVPGVAANVPYGYSNSYFPGVFHTGIDYADGCRGTAIRAAGDGEIVVRVSGRPNTYPWSYEYGNYVKIQHSNGMYSLYGHMR